ncbi:hypothetical protein CHS0354_035111, partial [Potamilus streckersoni]
SGRTRSLQQKHYSTKESNSHNDHSNKKKPFGTIDHQTCTNYSNSNKTERQWKETTISTDPNQKTGPITCSTKNQHRQLPA